MTSDADTSGPTDGRSGVWDPPPPPPPPPAARVSWLDVPIARDVEGKRIAGVIAGICRSYGFERRTTRIATVIGAVIAPALIGAYVAAWLLLPKRVEDAASLRAIFTNRRRRPLIVVLAIGAVVTGFGSWGFYGGVGWGICLLAIGVLLWLSPNFGSTFRTPVTGAQGPGVPGVPGSPSVSGGSVLVGPDGRPLPNQTVPSSTSTSTRRRKKPVQALALAAATAGAIVAGVGNSAGWWDASTYGIVLGVLITLIAGTVLGAIVNRSWLGVPMLFVFGACTAGLVVTHPNLEGGIGERTLRPTTVADLAGEHHLGVGRLTLDLRSLPLEANEQVTLAASIGYGQIRVLVPQGLDVRLDADINAGHIVVNGDETSSGMRRDDVIDVFDAPGESAPQLVLDLSVGGGEINITQR